jgi:hypothetical protein
MWYYYKDGRLIRDEYDANRDGEPDGWRKYTAGELVEEEYDRDFDGTPDFWRKYSSPGQIDKVIYDRDLDGRADYWETHKDAASFSYTADNDGDEQIDEWGKTYAYSPSERNWSFKNDRIVDKKALYKKGRKVKELYDRDRDGEFDEWVFLDEFERVIKTERQEEGL